MRKIAIIATIALFSALQLKAQTKVEKIENKMNTKVPKISDFPTGEENTGFAKYFTGKSYLAPLTNNKDLNVPLANVTFEPGCRNNWHSHTGGQLLIVVGGEGLYQERGKSARHLKAGDIVEIAPNIEHWHGATSNSWFSHLATNGSPLSNENKWLEAVSDEEYNNAHKQINK
ncbi:cupin domain-containing protein [Pedobacter jejuensis]|uniref:Cupin domain-containing protein n=1 Tax=Pedobacter jejuensis TaxID=1268550 RepID=A0A3N0BVW1_9SPHI|nr:cupin domain-containing protein [Pedobacter jejuensis]RNL53470.1 cupin domain-containing protein [Pedobacter jejuensis]